MLAWLIAFSSLISASVASPALGPGARAIVKGDFVLNAILMIQFAGLYQTFYMSKDFRELAYQTIKFL